MKWQFICDDVLQAASKMPDMSFAGCLCDPPYGIKFMGKSWDHGVPSKEVWVEVLRVLKPGAFLLAYGGTRTHHRLACNIEDAGFEIRDCLMWLYGSGFPKSLDIGKAIDKSAGAERQVLGKRIDGRYAYGFTPEAKRALGNIAHAETKGFIGEIGIITEPATSAAKIWDGYGTALKPAWEPCIVAMKPLDGSFTENASKHGVAGINIDAGRIHTTDELKGGALTGSVAQPGGFDRPWMHNEKAIQEKMKRSALSVEKSEALGRWPANLILDEESAAILDEQSGESASAIVKSMCQKAIPEQTSKGAEKQRIRENVGFNDYGGASRFFYCAKVDTEEREAGITLEKQLYGAMSGHEDGSLLTGEGNVRNNTARNNHPTLKPKDLNKYLAKLILPPEGHRKILVPFSGAGSEIIGAILAGWDEAIGIEKEQAYIDIAEQRCHRWLPTLFM